MKALETALIAGALIGGAALPAGSGSVSVFRVLGNRLVLTDREPSGGSEPNAMAVHDNLVYVLNTAGSSSVVGFQLREGKLTRIRDRFATLAATPSSRRL